MGMAMTDGTLVRWLKQPGDAVVAGEPVAEIETDKATMELESDFSGWVGEQLFAEGAQVPVGEAILRIVDTKPAETAQGTEGGAKASTTASKAGGAGEGADAVPAIVIPDRAMYRKDVVLVESTEGAESAEIDITGLDSDQLLELAQHYGADSRVRRDER